MLLELDVKRKRLNQNGSEPIQTVKEALDLIDQYGGSPESFSLSIPISLLNEMGVAMAIVTDKVLAKGWLPNGYIEQDSIRTFK